VFARVETLVVKSCPFCEAELHDSVIRCTRCLRSLDGKAEPEHEPVPTAAPSAVATRVEPGLPADGPSAWATQDWTSPTTRSADLDAGPAFDVGALRALPRERRHSARPDFVLLLASLAAAAAAYLAWKAVSEPWVELTITDTSDLDPVLVGNIMLRGQLALVGTIGLALAGVLGTLGATWLFYGFDRGSNVPWFVNPVLAVVAATVAVAGAVLSSTVWFVWKDAAIERSRAVGLSPEKLKELLDLQPPPFVEIQRQAGLMRFGGMMLVGLLAASAALWSCRRRG
jgi:hypothetical protein